MDTPLTLLERIQTLPADSDAWDEFVRQCRPTILFCGWAAVGERHAAAGT
jgi:hypothetical protein